MLGPNGDVTRSHRWRKRALSTVMAAIVMIVVIVVVGAAAYFAVANNSTKSTNTQNVTTCQPVNSQICSNNKAVTQVHDLKLFTPFKAAQTQNPVPFTAQVPASESASSYTFNFGDGSTTTTSATSVSHTYSTPGNYLVLLTAVITGQTSVHDNYNALAALSVTAGYSAASGGANPTVSGAIVSNGTSTTGPSAVLLSGGSVTVAGAYTGAPTNPLFTLGAPSIGVSISPSGATAPVVSNMSTS
ncbi:MAG: PKD domain-containing protein, partial [Thermoplasmata archaeon]|nr:PKD domain-containing protein [Thermoplasmata archaeon]